MMMVMEITVSSQPHPRVIIWAASILTERPKRSFLVRFEALDETDAVFLRGGLQGAGIEVLVVDVDILETLEVLLSALDPKVTGSRHLLRSHGEGVDVNEVALVNSDQDCETSGGRYRSLTIACN